MTDLGSGARSLQSGSCPAHSQVVACGTALFVATEAGSARAADLGYAAARSRICRAMDRPSAAAFRLCRRSPLQHRAHAASDLVGDTARFPRDGDLPIARALYRFADSFPDLRCFIAATTTVGNNREAHAKGELDHAGAAPAPRHANATKFWLA